MVEGSRNVAEESLTEKRRQQALERIAQGKIGPQYGHLGGRPRKASTLALEQLNEYISDGKTVGQIAETMESLAFGEDSNPWLRLQAVRTLLEWQLAWIKLCQREGRDWRAAKEHELTLEEQRLRIATLVRRLRQAGVDPIAIDAEVVAEEGS